MHQVHCKELLVCSKEPSDWNPCVNCLSFLGAEEQEGSIQSSQKGGLGCATGLCCYHDIVHGDENGNNNLRPVGVILGTPLWALASLQSTLWPVRIHEYWVNTGPSFPFAHSWIACLVSRGKLLESHVKYFEDYLCSLGSKCLDLGIFVWMALHTPVVSDGPSVACAMCRHSSYVVQWVRLAAGREEGKYPSNPSNQTSSSLALIVTHDPTDDTWWPKEGVNDMFSKQK